MGRAAEAADEGRERACYDGTDTQEICGRRESRVSTVQKEIKVGDAAPNFTLKTIGLKDISLHDYKGKNVVLLFYPLDWTPG